MNLFDRESGDMLPRPAPKPSSPPNEDMFKPAVPEVSMLFDQKHNNQQTENSKQKEKSPARKTQTYAAWKKQMLPQVAYPSSERDNLVQNEMPLNEIYPLRAPMTNTQPLYGYNYENVPCYYQNISPYQMTSRSTSAPVNVCQTNYQRRSLDTISTQINDAYRYTPSSQNVVRCTNEVLTLCASTQTDADLERNRESFSPQTLRQLATKSDIDRMLDIVQQMRNDQLRLMLICETLAVQQKQQQADTQTRTQTTEAGTQYEQKTATLEPNLSTVPPKQAVICNVENNRQNGPVQPARFQTPRMPPAAQSTAYQGHTPPGILRRSVTSQAKATDITLAMNELAMKYLPDEKLHELMNDMQLTAPRNPIMERVMIASKGPTDISNASYKYLKKYRLLPEEANASAKTMRFYEEDARHSQPNSPYEQRPVDSPMILRRAASEGVDINENHDNNLFNLEDLRNKPKFM